MFSTVLFARLRSPEYAGWLEQYFARLFARDRTRARVPKLHRSRIEIALKRIVGGSGQLPKPNLRSHLIYGRRLTFDHSAVVASEFRAT